jgi:pSer/pThr/pTyr-binding forkhead associated (FHA) protein
MNEQAAFLKALTPESQASLGGLLLEIPRLPFRVGRESRSERRSLLNGGAPATVPNNDLYLAETDAELNVSREHFQIDRRGGGYELTDRGSSCGTLVEGERIGGHHQIARKPLADGDVIIVGTSRSRYAFKFLLAAKTVAP